MFGRQTFTPCWQEACFTLLLLSVRGTASPFEKSKRSAWETRLVAHAHQASFAGSSVGEICILHNQQLLSRSWARCEVGRGLKILAESEGLAGKESGVSYFRTEMEGNSGKQNPHDIFFHNLLHAAPKPRQGQFCLQCVRSIPFFRDMFLPLFEFYNRLVGNAQSATHQTDFCWIPSYVWCGLLG